MFVVGNISDYTRTKKTHFWFSMHGNAGYFQSKAVYKTAPHIRYSHN